MEGQAASARKARLQFALGCVASIALLAGLAEIYLRLFPPSDLHPYLGEASPLTGLYTPDDDFGVTYRSWQDFHADNADRMAQFGQFTSNSDDRKIWAFFGNSFIHMTGMLADTVRAKLPERRVFNLGRNEHFCVRFAQIKLLLDNGLEPERIFVELMALDTTAIGKQPLATFQITSRGALTYRPRLPAGPAGWPVRESRLAFTAWVRSGQQLGDPHFQPARLNQRVEEHLQEDLKRLFDNLARVTRRHHVPVTIILIPNYEQVMRGTSCAFQDTVGPILRQQGLDVFDPRDAFLQYPNHPALFIPDKHFSPPGNELLLAELLRHLHSQEAVVHAGQESDQP